VLIGVVGSASNRVVSIDESGRVMHFCVCFVFVSHFFCIRFAIAIRSLCNSFTIAL
jgi:hypothetical protein